jgi:cytochrome P450
VTTSTPQATTQAPRVPRPAEELPGPRRVPVFGNAFQIDTTRLHQQLEQLCDEFGAFFKMQLVKRRILVVGDHEAIAQVLRDRPDGFRRTSRLEEIWTELGMQPFLFGMNGDIWRRQRRMVMAGFDPAHVKRYFPSLLKVAQRLAERWRKAAREGRGVDLQADLMRYTVDTIAGLAFGAEVNTLESNGDVIQQHLNRIFPAVFNRVLAPMATWRFLRTPADRQLEQSVSAVKIAVAGFVGEARARMQADPSRRKDPPNLLEAMIAAADEPGSDIDDEQIAGNVFGMLLAGEDTTANTIAWMIYLLWRNPKALVRATEEVRRTLGDPANPTLDEFARLDYLEACLHETLRLKPVAPILPLEALREVTIGDVRVPAGWVVFCLMRRDSADERLVPRASAFEPERWLAEGGPTHAADASKRTSMPFGAGPRICPGRYLAMLEIKIAMATLLGHFDIDSIDTPDGQEAREHLAFTMSPVGLRMRLRERAPRIGEAS